MSGRRMEALVALAVASATLAIAAPAGAQAASSHPVMAKKASSAAQHTMKQHTVKVKEATPGLAAEATVSADSAQKIALAQVARGWVREAKLVEENGTLVYSYDVKARGKSGVEEVMVDAKTGAVVSSKHETAKAEAKEAASEKKVAKAARPKSRPMSKSTVAPKTPTGGVSTTKP